MHAMNTPASNLNAPPTQDGSHGDIRRWTVLFIGDHGKVIAFKRVKILLALAGAAFLLSLAAVCVLAVVNQTLHRRNTELQQGLAASAQSIRDLRHERDLLTAQAVLLETRMNETLAGGNRSSAEEVMEPVPAGAADKAPSQPPPGPPGEASASGKSPAPTSAPAAVRAPLGMGEGIAAEDLGIKYHRGRNTLELRFKIVNTSPGHKPLNGHVVAVLKGSHLEPREWMAMPRVGLTNGRPSGGQPGYRFSISHSKAFTQTMSAPRDLPAYDAAILYVFSNAGELLTAREFSVDISPSAPE
jgi:hypothetical protein